MSFEIKEKYNINDFIELMEHLRSPMGCPWDAEQTHESISRNAVEEAYETAEAIESGNLEAMKEELGDLLMQVVFHAQIGRENGEFDFDDVADAACKKLVFRHPHVFADAQRASESEALERWDAAKRQEKGQRSVSEAMDSVAKNLPSLWRAEKIQGKAANVGFKWPDVSYAIGKIREETEELDKAVAACDEENIFEEIGDLLFAAVNAAKLMSVDPEKALNAACDKYIRRFSFMEDKAAENGKKLDEMSLVEMEKLYQLGRKELEGKKIQFILDK